MKRHPRHIVVTKRWPERYFAGLSRSLKLARSSELLKRRKTPYSKLKLSKTNAGGT